MKNIGLFAIVSIMIFACGKADDKKNSLFSATNNMDANNFWINTNTIAKGNAHSGLYAAKIDTSFEYGIGIAAKIDDLSTTLPQKVYVHCWVYSSVSNLNAFLVCDETQNGQTLGWENFDLKTITKNANEWIELTASYNLPKNITPDSKLSVYFWNPKKQVFFVDDFEVTLE